ncbi:MAG TPA: fumarylacetoacetase [Terriglobales bacterium]|nr:fumarylacetoacetase [Terriglobales bacterium]
MNSWLASANEAKCDFPLHNLPYGAYRARGGASHLCVAIGDCVLDLHGAAATGALGGVPEETVAACQAPVLNRLMALGPEAGAKLRARLQAMLADRAPEAEQRRVGPLLHPQAEAEMLLALEIGDYTDFYASREHAFNVGSLFRPANPLLPNYAYLPVGYHGRSSSVGVSPQEVRRPMGQRPAATPEGAPPTFGPSRQLDYELEVGFVIGQGNRLGEPIRLQDAERHVFGLCLLNDWSARDIQRWEYQPLGPFLGKNFATTLSPWVIPLAALAPFRGPGRAREAGDPALLPYLDAALDRSHGGFQVRLTADLISERMREHGMPALRVCESNLGDLYWTMAQMVTHHASNGCNLRPGDLLGSGTVSSAGAGAQGCLLEATQAGRKPLELPSGEPRAFLEDGDEVLLQAYCQNAQGLGLGWGVCKGRVLPALEM